MPDQIMNNVIRLHGDVITVTPKMIEELVQIAEASPLQRARYCLHPDDASSVQEMVIVITRLCDVRPHRHLGKAETFYLLSGEMDVTLYDDEGKATCRLELGDQASGKARSFRLAGNRWHSVRSVTPYVVFSEVTEGPFSPSHSEFPSWDDGA